MQFIAGSSFRAGDGPNFAIKTSVRNHDPPHLPLGKIMEHTIWQNQTQAKKEELLKQAS